MMSKTLFALVAAGSAIVAVRAYISLSDPRIDDLALVAVDVVKHGDMPDHDWLASWGPGGPLVFRVRLSTSHDLEQLARTRGYGARNITTICRGTAIDKSKEIGYPQVDDEFASISPYWQSKTPNRDRTVSGAIVYHVYFNVDLGGGGELYNYDLAREPQDVCVQIEVGNDLGMRFTSNVVRVPRQTIIDAMNRAGIAHRP